MDFHHLMLHTVTFMVGVMQMQVYIYLSVLMEGVTSGAFAYRMVDYTLVAFLCYLFFLAEFLIYSGMSVVADQRYMKLWSELSAPRANCT